LTLQFARGYRALFAYERLVATGTMSRFSEIIRAVVLMLLKTFCLVIFMAGTVFTVEVLGEPEFMRHRTVPTSMGGLDFVQMFYWVFTTITTVGYGDYSPTTTLARLLIIVFIVWGVLFFSLESARILALGEEMSRGRGKYYGPSGHVLVVGGGVRTYSPSVRSFLNELFSPENGPHVAMLAAVPKSADITKEMSAAWTKGRLSFFEGSPMERDDLARVRIHDVSMAFVLADSLCRHPDEEDQANILRAISLHRAAPKMRMRVMLLRPSNKIKAISVGLPVRMCYAFNELKSNLLAQSCRCPGYSTLLMNLNTTDEEVRQIYDSPRKYAMLAVWQQMYAAGALKTVTGCILADEHVGHTFAQVCHHIFMAIGNMPLAAQINGKLVVAPLEHIMQTDDVIFVIAPAGAHLKKSAKHTEHGDLIDYRDHFAHNQLTMSIEDSRNDNVKVVFQEEESIKQPIKTRLTSTNRKKAPSVMQQSLMLPQFAASKGLLQAQTEADPIQEHFEVENATHGNERITQYIAAEFGQAALEKRNRDVNTRRKEEALAARDFITAGGHILLLISQSELLWQQMLAFIRPLRAPYLATTKPIVVLTPVFPPKSTWDLFPDVAFIEGSPTQRDDLEMVGAVQASRVILLAGPPRDGQERNLADSDATLVSSTVERLSLEAGVPLNFGLYEYVDPDNIQLVSQAPSTALDSQIDSGASEAVPDEVASAFLSARYASGRICAPSVLGSVFGQAFETLGMLELCEAMLMPSRRGQTCYPYLFSVPPGFVDHSYGDLVAGCLTDGLEIIPNESVLIIGLYRRFADIDDSFDAETDFSFVLTNPPAEEPLLAHDQMYVFASEAWGKAMTALQPKCDQGCGHLLEQLSWAPQMTNLPSTSDTPLSSLTELEESMQKRFCV